MNIDVVLTCANGSHFLHSDAWYRGVSTLNWTREYSLDRAYSVVRDLLDGDPLRKNIRKVELVEIVDGEPRTTIGVFT